MLIALISSPKRKSSTQSKVDVTRWPQTYLPLKTTMTNSPCITFIKNSTSSHRIENLWESRAVGFVRKITSRANLKLTSRRMGGHRAFHKGTLSWIHAPSPSRSFRRPKVDQRNTTHLTNLFLHFFLAVQILFDVRFMFFFNLKRFFSITLFF